MNRTILRHKMTKYKTKYNNLSRLMVGGYKFNVGDNVIYKTVPYGNIPGINTYGKIKKVLDNNEYEFIDDNNGGVLTLDGAEIVLNETKTINHKFQPVDEDLSLDIDSLTKNFRLRKDLKELQKIGKLVIINDTTFEFINAQQKKYIIDFPSNYPFRGPTVNNIPPNIPPNEWVSANKLTDYLEKMPQKEERKREMMIQQEEERKREMMMQQEEQIKREMMMQQEEQIKREMSARLYYNKFQVNDIAVYNKNNKYCKIIKIIENIPRKYEIDCGNGFRTICIESELSRYKKEDPDDLPTRDDAIRESNYKFNLKKKL